MTNLSTVRVAHSPQRLQFARQRISPLRDVAGAEADHEIAAVLKAARESTDGKIIAVVQPHRFTRLQSLFEEFCTCFNDADTVVVAEVYPAGEAPIPGVDRDHFVLGLRAHGHREVIALQHPANLARLVHDMATPGDFVVCLGAGNITQWAYALPDELKALG